MIRELPQHRAYIEFKQIAVEDRQASIKEGHYVAKDVDYAVITPSGGNLQVEQEVTPDLLKQWESNAETEYRAKAYEHWKKGLETPEEGTPLRSCPIFSPAQVETLARLGIRTVENCATMPEQVLQKVGMGARDMQQKALKWLEAAESGGKVAERLRSLEQRIQDMEAESERKDKLIAELSEKRRRPKNDAA